MAAAVKKTAAPKKAVAAQAMENEATDTSGEFEFKGVTFTVPSQMDMPFAVLKAIRTGDEIDIVAAMLGPKQWAAFEDSEPTIGEFQEFTEKVAEVAGFGDPGN
ncbi:hypothetical protein ACFY1P_08150 [Streptomyces sp. NPDC001407]|uniref:hypothetical protein n=1 Tax=Streptomyces sp. NPDC001407 TaxID=3364573 RepID=UPI0036C7D244